MENIIGLIKPFLINEKQAKKLDKISWSSLKKAMTIKYLNAGLLIIIVTVGLLAFKQLYPNGMQIDVVPLH